MVNIETFREMALSFPDAVELPHFERTSFRVNKKIFATLDVKKQLACIMLSETDQYIFCGFDKAIIYPVPNKWGLKGATYLELKTVGKKMVKDMLKAAYGKVAAKKSPVKKR